jgi:heptosyltransferase-2
VLVRVVDAVGWALINFWRLFRRAQAVDHPRRILVVQLDHLGDAVLSSPLFPRLRAAYPDARIDVLASPSNEAIFQADPNVGRVVLAERNWFERRPGGWALGSVVWALGRSLRGERYDLGIDVRGDILTVLVLALARIPRRVGWTMGGGGFLLTDVAPWVPGRHEVESRLALLEQIGLRGDCPTRVLVHVTDRDRARVARRLRAAWRDRPARRAPARTRTASARAAGLTRLGARPLDHDEGDLLHAGRFGASAPLLAVHLGAGTLAKRWPISYWRELIARFLNDGWRIILIGGPEDVAISSAIPPQPGVQDWTGRLPIGETAALLERADLFIGADSGPAHVAASAGVMSVVIFSGTNLAHQWRPWSRRSLVLKHKVPCSPCHLKVCPLAGHNCMTGLTPDRVHRAARRWWDQVQRSKTARIPLGSDNRLSWGE